MGHGKTNGTPGSVADVDAATSLKYRVPAIDLATYEIDSAVLLLVPKRTCELHNVIPVSRIADSLVVAMADPTEVATLDALSSLTGLKIEPVIATAVEIATAIAKYYR